MVPTQDSHAHQEPQREPAGRTQPVGQSPAEEIEKILDHARVKKLMEENPNISGKIESAVELLYDEKYPVQAIYKSAMGLIQNKVKVFVSYKMDVDDNVAGKLVQLLRKYSAGKLDVTYAADFTKLPGSQWPQLIRESIEKSHWFILLLPDRTFDWDWCLFETGLFRRGIVSNKVNKLICIHHPDLDQEKLPPQTSDFQRVKANVEGMRNFLEMVFLKENPIPGMDPINKEIADDLDDEALKIVNIMSEPIKSTPYQRRLKIKVSNHRDRIEEKDLDEAEILEIDERTLTMFGKEIKPKTWKDLTSNIRKPGADRRWMTELLTSIQQAARGDIPDPVYATFKGMYSGKMWRPLLHAMDQTSSGLIESFRLLFIEEIGAMVNGHIPKSVLALITVLKYAYRFHWEVIERFEHGITEDEVNELEDIIEQMTAEAHSRGVIAPEELCKNFDASTGKEIGEIFKRWYELRNDEKAGELDVAIRERDVGTINTILSELTLMNTRFIHLASDRLKALSV